ncbi:class I SAM-dependent methyltransferase [Nereida sp. MMG025]|uniref:class I SAM-dependent methyltransferase n=1 Tax=Nereida sp. MMG025 TaxID=2909981 RepID=UPI001F30BA1B|nr:class I SAM-dependent methyltransferase [Nereida sp. MMG025]MCF6444113.1 class I SAM-dependent methyltransferase [Nereida sp. MMG025]
MHLDVLDLKTFYYRSRLGRAAQAAIRGQVQTLWPEAKGQTVVGFGFAVPLLRPFMAEARRTIGLMPGPQGVMPWPAGMQNVSVLCDETWWPLQTGQVDKLIVLHGLETSERPSAVLDEAFRVLGPGGRALFIVPNRAGIWARRDKTPFGYGRPYSLSQLEAQVKSHGFVPERHVSSLYQPPSDARFWRKTAPFWERTGARMPLILAGGALILEVSKQVYAPRQDGERARAPSPLKVLEGIGSKSPRPVGGVGRTS